MKYTKISLSLILTSIILAVFVSAGDNAPPALPSEFWGDLTQNGVSVPDSLSVTGEVNSVNYAQASTTLGGLYDILLVGGDRELTYFTDQDCSIHWAADEACVPCSGEADCIEGPQDDDLIKIKVDNSLVPLPTDGAMPYTEWERGSNYEMNIVTPIGDWAMNGCVSTADIPAFADHYEETCADPGWDPIYDLNWDCLISTADIPVFADHYEEGC